MTRSLETFSLPQPSPPAKFKADEFNDDEEEELQEAEVEVKPSQSSWGGGLEESFLSKRWLMDSSKSTISHDSEALMSSIEPSIAQPFKFFCFWEKNSKKILEQRERERKRGFLGFGWDRRNHGRTESETLEGFDSHERNSRVTVWEFLERERERERESEWFGASMRQRNVRDKEIGFVTMVFFFFFFF